MYQLDITLKRGHNLAIRDRGGISRWDPSLSFSISLWDPSISISISLWDPSLYFSISISLWDPSLVLSFSISLWDPSPSLALSFSFSLWDPSLSLYPSFSLSRCSRVVQRSKALHISARGVTADPGLFPGCITTGRNWEPG
ncbi:unnamed protein product [Oncorhynchus mykiss]|uniref:Uncharacterized protein n=1 Tax=Oncorhynchus mykiss TaxID=8022 RepID=A0A060YC61_ONCMY|nr:unnamed protein product [Oncorhynchus mykiss]